MMMFIPSSLLLLLQITLTYGHEQHFISIINGGALGDWGVWDMCPEGTVARGFQLQMESYQGLIVDDSGMNSIKLHCCFPGTKTIVKNITSSVGSWGQWEPTFWCTSGCLIKFKLKVEIYNFHNDNTAANAITFQCSDNSEVEPTKGDFGEYGPWSDYCTTCINGMKTRVQKPQGPTYDDTSLNNVMFRCLENVC